MTVTNQDVVAYRDDEIIAVTVTDDDGTAIDLSTVTGITYSVYDASKTLVFTKTKAAGQIAFVNSGTDGQITIALSDTDLTNLLGWYAHTLTMLDASGNISTLFTGRATILDRTRGD